MASHSPAAPVVGLRVPPPRTDRTALVLKVIAALAILSAPLWLPALFFSYQFEIGTSLVAVPMMLAACLVLAIALSRGDRFGFEIIAVGVIVKLMGAALFTFTVYQVYNAAADMPRYVTWGRQFADDIMRGEGRLLRPIWGGNFVSMLTGGVFLTLGEAIPAAVTMFSLASFWGQYLLWRAFTVAFPMGEHRLAALLLLFTPSLVFWTAAIGKDALVMFSLGLVAYGYARLTVQGTYSGVVVLVLGLGLTLLARPHMAGMISLALLVPYMVSRERRGVAGLLGRMIAVPLLVLGTAYLATQGAAYVEMSNYTEGESVVEKVARSNRMGGSKIQGGETLASRVTMAPFLLFRPFPWEVHNLQAAVAAAEALVLLVVSFRLRRRLLSLVLHARENPFVLFSLLYGAMFLITFSGSLTNLGLLARQRVMVLPFFLMLLCVPAPPGDPPPRLAWWRRRRAPAPPPVVGSATPALPRRVL